LANFCAVDLDFISFSVNLKELQKSWKFANYHSTPKIWGEKKNDPSLPMEKVFISIFCEGSHNGDPPQEELAKFGYRSESIVESFLRILLFMLATYWNLLCKYGNYRNCFPQNLMILVQFFARKSFA
jgi:hypothetical protein